MKPILYIDLDDTIADFTTPYLEQLDTYPFPQANYGFFSSLKPIAGAKASVKFLSNYFDIYFLTAPSVPNPMSYTEKRVWIEKHFPGMEGKLIICGHKHLMIGDYLIDDQASGKGQDKFKGQLIQFGSPTLERWILVTSYLMKQIKKPELGIALVNLDNKPTQKCSAFMCGCMGCLASSLGQINVSEEIHEYLWNYDET